MQIPIYKPFLEGNYQKYAISAIESTWISSRGPYIETFENKFSEFLGQNTHSSTVSNGTVALDLALRILGIGPGDEVILPSFTYVATANAIIRSGAIPVFVDSEALSWNMDRNKIEAKINSRTKAIMAVHIYGAECDINYIKCLAKKFGIFLIEDCAEAIGTSVGGQMVGTFGDVSTFSFFGNKTITTGEGGMVCSQNSKTIELAHHLKSQAVSKEREYWHDDVGYNFRMTNVQAAIGLSQIEMADEILEKKQLVYEQYNALLSNSSIEFQGCSEDCFHSRWMVAFQLKSKPTVQKVRAVLKKNGIETRPTFPLVSDFKMYEQYACAVPIAARISANGMCLPSFPQLTSDQIAQISKLILKEIDE